MKKYWPLYLLTVVTAIILKLVNQITDSNAFLWILTPTTRWVSILCGIPFEYLPHTGYVNHPHQFLIAPSCSGIRFMLILFLMLIFSFLHQISCKKNGYLWFLFSAAFSYASAILINGIRITISIYLPALMENTGAMKGWLTPDRLHTLLGTVTYFSALCLIYPLASFLCNRKFIQAKADLSLSHSISLLKLLTPIFWYLLIVLALPLLTRTIQNNWKGFASYTLTVTIPPLILTFLICLTRVLRRRAILVSSQKPYQQTLLGKLRKRSLDK